MIPTMKCCRSKIKPSKRSLNLGFTTIRFFATYPFAGRKFHTDLEERKKYYRIMDKIVSMLEKHNLSACICLGLKQFNSRELEWSEEKGRNVWVWGDEHERELLQDPNSQSRQYAYDFLDTIITATKIAPLSSCGKCPMNSPTMWTSCHTPNTTENAKAHLETSLSSTLMSH